VDEHLAPVCPHCGRQDCNNDVINVLGGRHRDLTFGAHASAREDYLAEECARAEEREEIARLDDAITHRRYRKALRQTREVIDRLDEVTQWWDESRDLVRRFRHRGDVWRRRYEKAEAYRAHLAGINHRQLGEIARLEAERDHEVALNACEAEQVRSAKLRADRAEVLASDLRERAEQAEIERDAWKHTFDAYLPHAAAWKEQVESLTTERDRALAGWTEAQKAVAERDALRERVRRMRMALLQAADGVWRPSGDYRRAAGEEV
jgi:hypothetical protein